MTDALLSPESFSVLSGAGLIDGSEKPITVHQTEQLVVGENDIIGVSNKPHVIEGEDYIYVMKLDSNGQVASEPFIYTYNGADANDKGLFELALKTEGYTADEDIQPKDGDVVIVDYYSDKSGSGVYQIDITPDKFGGAYYLEASTLFRDRATGKDMPAEFIIPNCRIQSNFTFTMASSGDPSTFDFVMDAFPDYTRFDKTQKVLAEIQIVGVDADEELTRIKTKSEDLLNSDDLIVDKDTLKPVRASDVVGP